MQGLVAFAVGLTLIVALWWVYFGTGDDEHGVHAFAQTPEAERSLLGARAYSAAHLLHIWGLVLCAVGLNAAIRQPMVPFGLQLGLTTAVGVALFLLGHAGYRSALALGSSRAHLVTAGLALTAGAASSTVLRWCSSQC